MRVLLFVVVVSLWLFVVYAYQRWVVRYRKLDELAKLLRQKDKSIGESLLGVIELSENKSEQVRSPALCAAAMEQVATEAAKRDLKVAAPVSHYQRWSWIAGSFAMIAITMLALFPNASINAAIRLAAPWIDVERYTFAKLEKLPDSLVVPHGEEFLFKTALQDQSPWIPAEATASIPHQDTFRSNSTIAPTSLYYLACMIQRH